MTSSIDADRRRESARSEATATSVERIVDPVTIERFIASDFE